MIAGGVALGLVASRLLKASSSDRYQQRTSGQPPERTVVHQVPEPDTTGPVCATDRAGHARRPGHADRVRREPLSHGRCHERWLRRSARERPIGELVKELSSQTSTLVRQEIELARAELQQKGKLAGKGAGMLGGAAIAALLALGALTAALIALLDKAMATWVAALIVMALWAIVAPCLPRPDRSRCSGRHRRHPRPSKP